MGLAGTIAFGREDGPDHWQLWRACADLSNPKQLTHGPGQQSGWPDFSPDGTRIAFNSDRDDPDMNDDQAVWDVYTMDTNGADVKKLTKSVDSSVDPAYSSDGKLIAFGWDTPGKEGIYVMDAVDGNHVRRITTLPSDARSDFSPHFSPDGSRIVFTRDLGDVASALFVVNVDGSGERRLTPPELDVAEADWSHDGAHIAFYAGSVEFPFESVWLIEPDGTHLQGLNTRSTTAGVQDGFSDAVWAAADDSIILLEHGLHFDGGAATVGLATMDPDGTQLRYVADGVGNEEKPDWSDATC